MFCTDEERRTCRVEKMGCEGCFYNNEKNNKKPFYRRLLEKYAKKGLEFAFRPVKVKFRYCIDVKDIKIKDEFLKTKPSERKMAFKTRYYKVSGKFYSPIVLNKKLYLIDGYTSYLIALENGVKTVDFEFGKD